jgi:hypothetical protein
MASRPSEAFEYILYPKGHVTQVGKFGLEARVK